MVAVNIPFTVIGGVQFTAALLWASLVAFGASYFDPTPSLFYASGLLLLAIVALLGLTVSHGRWAWGLTIGVFGLEAVAAVLVEPTAWWWAGLAVSAGAVFITVGPWIDPHVRQLPPPTPLPNQSLGLMIGLLFFPSILALTNEIDVWAAILALGAVVVAWAYGRAFVTGLWASRLLLLPLAVVVAVTGSWIRAVVAVGLAAAMTVLAWSAGARSAAIPLDPRRVQTSPVFPELAPPEVLDAAGYDERGRPRS